MSKFLKSILLHKISQYCKWTVLLKCVSHVFMCVEGTMGVDDFTFPSFNLHVTTSIWTPNLLISELGLNALRMFLPENFTHLSSHWQVAWASRCPQCHSGEHRVCLSPNHDHGSWIPWSWNSLYLCIICSHVLLMLETPDCFHHKACQKYRIN